MKFEKYHGLGNDFLITEDLSIVGNSELIKSVCNRYTGIGSDGLIIVKKDPLEMIFYNQDGTRGEMCGNGIRCFSYYCYNHNLLDSNNFDTAWNKLRTIASGTSSTSSSTSSTTTADTLTDIRQFLVIEEINRGNCAQIFGDIFQLLDRKLGYSEYPIEADEDIQKALLDENPDDGLSFGKDGLTLPEQVKNELRRVFEGDANPDAIIEKICMGKVLALPSWKHRWECAESACG